MSELRQREGCSLLRLNLTQRSPSYNELASDIGTTLVSRGRCASRCAWAQTVEPVIAMQGN